ncbi:MAG: histidine phosphatase family protein [Acidobacteriota bacterium]|nr:histidine phosphatase family protein [Acidobacteriota bacterium]
MTRILLIRHGSNDLLGRVLYGRMPGVHLNPEGALQARNLAQELKKYYALDAIVSSPLERALETAQPIAEAQNKPLVTDEGITELDFGCWAGQSFEKLYETDYWRNFNRQRSLNWPSDGESLMEVQTRAWRSISVAAERYGDDSTVAMVTHGDVIRSVLLLVLGMAIDHIHRLEVAPTSVSEILVGEHQPTVRRVNQIFY